MAPGFARGNNPHQKTIYGRTNINYQGPSKASSSSDGSTNHVRNDFSTDEGSTDNNNTTVRTMVSLRTIDSIHPIEGADAIERATVGGWNVVVGKDTYTPGDKVLYFEIDSFLPEDDERFTEFAKRGRKTVTHPDTGEEITGHVLKTAKLRGVYSQGLVIGTSQFPELGDEPSQEDITEVMDDIGVFKYEKPLPVSMSGEIIGHFPDTAQKTDAERVQNLSDEFLGRQDPEAWYATEKIDGTSVTFLKENGELKVCSRNYQIAHDGANMYSQMAQKLNLEDIMTDGQVIQGEIYGEGIQGNTLGMKGTHLAVFHAEGVEGTDVQHLVDELEVPVVDIPFPCTVDEAVRQADGFKSTISPQRNAEGVVWWNKNGEKFPDTGDRANFKCINNKWLLKNDS